MIILVNLIQIYEIINLKKFNNAYKSNLINIIIDDFERLIRYRIGPRFNNLILQTLLTVIRKAPKDSIKKILMIIIQNASC